MNFLKGIFGYGKDLASQLKSTQFEGTLYRVINNGRKTIFDKCRIKFILQKGQKGQDQYLFTFKSHKNQEKEDQYNFPIHIYMNPVTFPMTKEGKSYSCFQWLLQESSQEEHIGCYVEPTKKNQFKDLLCKIIKVLFNDENIKNHLELCEEINTFPSYKNKTETSKSSKISSKITTEFNDLLLAETSKKQNKFVFTASCYQIISHNRKLLHDKVVMVIRTKGKFQYQIQLLNEMGFPFKRQEITGGLHYTFNIDEGYMKWLHIGEGEGTSSIIEVDFGKRDVAMSAKFAIMECLYEINTKRKVTDVIADQQLNYMKRIDQQPNFSQKLNKQIVKTYQTVEQLEICEKQFTYDNKDVHQGLQKYRNLCQAKIGDFQVASLGSMLEVLQISEDNKVLRTDKIKLYGKDKRQLDINQVLLHDNDSKALLHGENGRLYYYDLPKGVLLKEMDIVDSSKAGIQYVCPEFKLAETSNFKTFKAVSPNTIYEIDPRTPKDVVQEKTYTTATDFCKIGVNSKGNYAVGSKNGDIRLFDGIGKNANCKHPGFGDPVLHLDSTKDGKWLLATFKTYILLLPTESQEVSLYEKKMNLNDRPRAIKLQIKMQHLQMFKIKMQALSMVPAKFDERKDSKERFIISGLDQYVVIWNLGHVLKGNLRDYKFTKVDGEMVQADFKFNNVSKLIMTTSKGITIKENKIQTEK